jgi:hypothetical protein
MNGVNFCKQVGEKIKLLGIEQATEELRIKK